MFSGVTIELQKIQSVIKNNPEDKACINVLNELRPTVLTAKGQFA